MNGEKKTDFPAYDFAFACHNARYGYGNRGNQKPHNGPDPERMDMARTVRAWHPQGPQDTAQDACRPAGQAGHPIEGQAPGYLHRRMLLARAPALPDTGHSLLAGKDSAQQGPGQAERQAAQADGPEGKAPMGVPTVVSLFAGCGGSTLGYRWAGFRELLAVDLDTYACKIFSLNFPDIPVWQKDIGDITAKQIMQFCKIKEGQLDVLDGSPPCQGFSLSGKRQVGDLRNALFDEYIRLVDGLRPKIFVAENVSGMVKGTMKGRFKEIMAAFKALSYRVECRMLNAMWYGTPQSRERLFFIGVRADIERVPAWPRHTVDKPICIADALQATLNGEDELQWARHYSANKKLQNILKRLKPGETADKYDPKGHYFNIRRMDFGRPTWTIISEVSPRSIFLMPNEDRTLTISELKRLCSFPDNFRLKGPFRRQWGLLGNAVMPLQMKAITETIRMKILDDDKLN